MSTSRRSFTPVTQAVIDWTLQRGMQASLLALLRGIRKLTLIEYAGATHGIPVSERARVTRDLLAFLK